MLTRRPTISRLIAAVLLSFLLATSVTAAAALQADSNPPTPSSADVVNRAEQSDLNPVVVPRTYFPIFEKDHNGRNATLYLQNLGTSTATVVIDAFDLQGGVFSTEELLEIPARGGATLSAADFASLSPGSYALIVSSDQPHAGVVNIFGMDEGPALSSYTGISSLSLRSAAQAPVEPYRAHFGPYHKDGNTSFLWNTATTPATAMVEVYTLQGTQAGSVTREIPAQQQITVVSEDIPGVPADTHGWAVVSSDQPLVGLLHIEGSPHLPDPDITTDGALRVDSPLATLPRVFKNVIEYGGARSSIIFIGNGGSADTDIFVTFFDTSGKVETTKTYEGIGALGGVILDVASLDDLPDGQYSVRAEAAEPIGISERTAYRTVGDAVAAAYTGVACGSGFAFELCLPRIASTADTHTRFSVLNEGASEAMVVVEYYDHNGRSAGHSQHTLAPGGAVREDPEGIVPMGFEGSAVVMADQPVGVRVDEYRTVVCDPPTDAQLTVTPSGPVEVGTALQFSATAEGTPPLAYAWDFDDGDVATGYEVVHSFAQPGKYEVTMRVENACGSTSTSHTVEVTPVYTDWVYLPLVTRYGH